jgi:hypothetical protein
MGSMYYGLHFLSATLISTITYGLHIFHITPSLYFSYEYLISTHRPREETAAHNFAYSYEMDASLQGFQVGKSSRVDKVPTW